MSELDNEFLTNLKAIQQGKENFSENDQNAIINWVHKFSEPIETDEGKIIRNHYARILASLVNEQKQLVFPFTESPPEEDLPPLPDLPTAKKFQIKKIPCARPRMTQGTGAIPKARKPEKPHPVLDFSTHNEFEDSEEMAKVIARSKGQSFVDFVVSIARHTSDYGQELRNAMNTETSSFREYVDHVLSQRIKDLTEVLDKEQNRELLKIKKDVERWQCELSQVKKRIKEMVPVFDVDLYKKDKNYVKKIFTIEAPFKSHEDYVFQTWKEENFHRLKWISEMACKIAHCNEQIAQEILNVKSDTLELENIEAVKQQNHEKYINCEISAYQKLKLERDRLHKENADLQLQLQQLEN